MKRDMKPIIEKMLKEHMQAANTDIGSALCNTLSELMHVCHATVLGRFDFNLDFNQILQKAKDKFESEVKANPFGCEHEWQETDNAPYCAKCGMNQ